MPHIHIVDAALNDPRVSWSDRDRKNAHVDGGRVLESLLADLDEGAIEAAMKRQGFRGRYRHIIRRLREPALARRSERNKPRAHVLPSP